MSRAKVRRSWAAGGTLARTIKHIVLAGDSIFDNDAYLPGEPGVIEQMRRALPREWSALKVAVDGDCIADVWPQLADLPTHATDLIVSVGGNDALSHSALLSKVRSFEDLEPLLHQPLMGFRAAYRDMLDRLVGTGLNVHVCTIYTAIPFTEPLWREFVPPALARFNAIIINLAEARGLRVFRLDEVCTDEGDFAAVSPIEPSAQGGQKIVDAILAGLADP